MDKLNTIRTRKHPGGLRGFITTFRILFLLGIVISGIMILVSVGMSFSNTCQVMVISKKTNSARYDTENHDAEQLRLSKTTGIYRFRPRNIFDRVLMGWIGWRLNLVSSVFAFLVTINMYRIFKILDLDDPFSIKIASYIKFIGLIGVIAWIVNMFTSIYIHLAIKTLTNGVYLPVSDKEVNLGIYIIILIIAAIYRRGCELQQEKDLTI